MSLSPACPNRPTEPLPDGREPGFRALAESARQGVVRIDADGRPTYANDAACVLLGLERPRDGSVPPGLAAALPAGAREHGGSVPRGVPVELGSRAAARPIRLRAVPLDGDDGGTLLLLEEAARRAERGAASGSGAPLPAGGLLRWQVHELRAPLNALSLNVEVLRRSLLREDGEPDERLAEQLESLDVLQREVRRLGRSLDQVLERARPRLPDPRRRVPVAVRDLLDDVAALLAPGASTTGVEVSVELPEPGWSVLADADFLKEALQSLVLNAIEAQPGGGAVRLSARDGESGCRLVVEDDGPGLPEGLEGRVFEMDFTTKAHGSGIGLAVAHSLVECQGGRLRLESRPGGGAVATILLPRADGGGSA